jgi:hypothetical protein
MTTRRSSLTCFNLGSAARCLVASLLGWTLSMSPGLLMGQSLSDSANIRAGTPYIPGLDQIKVGDSLDSVNEVVPSAERSDVNGGWVVGLDQSPFAAILYSYIVPRYLEQSRSHQESVNSIAYFFREDDDEGYARFRAAALRLWPSAQRDFQHGGYRIRWLDFGGNTVTLDRLHLVISVRFDGEPQ